MDLKTYRSNSMAGALAEVKKDLGPDAVILRTRNYRTGGVMGIGGNTVVEITAARETPASFPNGTGSNGSVNGARGAGAPTGTRRTASQGFDADAIERVRAAVRTPPPPEDTDPLGLVQRAQAVPSAPSVPPVRTPTPEPVPAGSEGAGQRGLSPTPVRFKPTDDRAYAALESELASIRQLVGDVLRTTRRTHIRVEGAGAFASSAVGPNDPLYSLYGTLCDNEVPSDIADEIVGVVRTELDAGEAREPAVIRETALRTIASRIPVATTPEPAEGPLVQALIGPTGVGKTTTIAKLAASYKLRHGRSVGLITADTYRIAAVDQLRTYAGIIGIPLEIVLDPSDLPRAMDKHASCDVVLVDTPGRSPRDAARLDQLSGVLEAIGPCRRHLVLSAGASGAVLRAAADRFGRMNPDALIVSKADEAGALGVLMDIARLTGLPLSFVTTGQEVPDDIEVARAERLARAVLDGGLPG